ncbi:MAG: hypothetical protein VR64_20475 [Desulfatitalea sp. BRH_c12]|nr:MAG: hypothetical protein VR64_20475 [Desulfatitalea sp. BRH_c12]
MSIPSLAELDFFNQQPDCDPRGIDPAEGLHIRECLGDILLGNIYALVSLALRGDMGQFS